MKLRRPLSYNLFQVKGTAASRAFLFLGLGFAGADSDA